MRRVVMTTPMTYLTRAAQDYGVSVEAIRSGSRKASVTAARQQAILDLRHKHVTRKGGQMSLSQIGQLTGVSKAAVTNTLRRRKRTQSLCPISDADQAKNLRDQIRRMAGNDLYLDMVRAYGISPVHGLMLALLSKKYPLVMSRDRYMDAITSAAEVSGISLVTCMSNETLKTQISRLRKTFASQGLPDPIENVGDGVTLSHRVAGLLHFRFGYPAKLLMEVA